jgi:hypothetical protein
MTEAETMELINVKRHSLEELRSANPTSSAAAVLEKEIQELESSLAKAAPKRQRKVFLDECAG